MIVDSFEMRKALLHMSRPRSERPRPPIPWRALILLVLLGLAIAWAAGEARGAEGPGGAAGPRALGKQVQKGQGGVARTHTTPLETLKIFGHPAPQTRFNFPGNSHAPHGLDRAQDPAPLPASVAPWPTEPFVPSVKSLIVTLIILSAVVFSSEEPRP